MSLYLKEIDVDDLSCNNPFVSGSWAEVKRSNSWSSKAFIIDIDDMKYEILILIKSIKLNFSIAYIPFGPNPLHDASLSNAIDNLSIINTNLLGCLPKSVFAIRYDLPFNYNDIKDCSVIDGSYFKIKEQSVQPIATTFIRLGNTLKTIQSNYRKRAKRHLKKNRGIVEIDEWNGSSETLSQWYSIYKKTGLIDNFSVRSLSYVKKILDMDNTILLLAKVNNEIAGGIIIIYGIDVAIYLFGGALKDCGYSVSYSLQDEAIKICNNKGVKYYDLFGIGSEKSNHLVSLNLFKTSFGGININRNSTFDYIIKPFVYFFFNLAEYFRYFFYRK